MTTRPFWPGLLLIAALASSAHAEPLEPGTHLRQLTHEDRERTYRFEVPPEYDGTTSVPLVVDLHGAGSDGVQQASISGYLPLAREQGFVVAHPDGIENSWNGTTCCGTAVREGIDDVGFLRAMVAAISNEVNIDASRVYATGLSNGGAMSHTVACQAADLFAAAAPMAFGLPLPPLCEPSRPIPIHYTMGLTDIIVDYAAAQPSFEAWQEINECVGEEPDTVVEQGEGTCESYTRCSGGTEVTLCSVVADDFAGTPLAFFAGHILYANPDFDLAAESWTLMSRHTLVPEPHAAALQLGALIALVGWRRYSRQRGQRH